MQPQRLLPASVIPFSFLFFFPYSFLSVAPFSLLLLFLSYLAVFLSLLFSFYPYYLPFILFNAPFCFNSAISFCIFFYLICFFQGLSVEDPGSVQLILQTARYLFFSVPFTSLAQPRGKPSTETRTQPFDSFSSPSEREMVSPLR